MRKIARIIISLALIFALLPMVTFNEASAKSESWVSFGRSTSRLNIRKSPGGEKIGVYPVGALIEVQGIEDQWLKVPNGYVFKDYVTKFDGYLTTGGFVSQGQFYDEHDMTKKNMTNLSIHYIGAIETNQIAQGVTNKRDLEEVIAISVDDTGNYCLPIYDVIGEYAYFPIAQHIYKLHIQCFTSFVWVSGNVVPQEIIGAYRTYYGHSSDNRKFNIEKVSSIVDGTVIEPGERFSYNETTGPRDKKAGYKLATVFSNGKKKDGYGGGVCQVSSTIYGAIYGNKNFTKVNRYPHSLEVTYIPEDMDATVSYKSQDLAFTNNYLFAIRLRVIAKDGVLIVFIQRV